MLSERKIQIGLAHIEFLGMKLSQGKYEAQPHIAQELLKFPDENLPRVQIQQFLDIVNYLRYFIPKLSIIWFVARIDALPSSSELITKR